MQDPERRGLFFTPLVGCFIQNARHHNQLAVVLAILRGFPQESNKKRAPQF